MNCDATVKTARYVRRQLGLGAAIIRRWCLSIHVVLVQCALVTLHLIRYDDDTQYNDLDAETEEWPQRRQATYTPTNDSQT